MWDKQDTFGVSFNDSHITQVSDGHPTDLTGVQASLLYKRMWDVFTVMAKYGSV